jgi:hypothetical protein
MTVPSLHDSVLEQRAAIRGMVAAAARAISPHYPLETFIARNPVADYERLSFEDAIQAVASDHGTGLTHPEPVFRRLLAEGRISADDLARAIAFHIAEARSRRILCCGRRRWRSGNSCSSTCCTRRTRNLPCRGCRHRPPSGRRRRTRAWTNTSAGG